MFRLIKLIFMILLINDKIFCDESITNSPMLDRTGLDSTDVGTFLTGIFAEEVNEGCPGQCIHTIVSLMCPNVLENATCNSPFQKCCATVCCKFIDDTLTDQATIVETSPPLEETTTTLTLSSEESQHSKNRNENKLTSSDSTQSTSLSIPLSTTLEPLTSFTSNIVKKFTIKCTGECIDSRSSKNCANILTNSGLCDDHQICCLQLNDKNFLATTSIQPSSSSDAVDVDKVSNLRGSSTSPIPSTSSVAQTTLAPSTTTLKTQSTFVTTNPPPTISENQSSLSEKKIVVEEEMLKNNDTLPSDNENSTSVLVKQSHNKNSDESTQVANNMPKCKNCVMMLFTLLCDAIDNTKSCPSGNKCCVYFDEENTPNKTEPAQQPPTTSTQSCQGTCLPIFLAGLCPHGTSESGNKKSCGTGWVCCESPDSQANSTSIYQNEKPPAPAMDYTDGTTFIEPSELTLNNLNNYNKLSTNKPPNYYQLVPRPPNLLVPPSQLPPNLLGLSSNLPFLNGNNQQKIPVYKPLLINSQMIPNPYLQNKNSLMNTGHALNNIRGGQSSYTQILNNLNTLNNLNNRSPPVSPPIYYLPSSNNPVASDDLFNTLNMQLLNSHLNSNTILPTVPSALKLNTTSNLINHLLLTNKIPQTSCTGTCMPSIIKFYCFRSNKIIYTNFVCPKTQVCCASVTDVEAYEAFMLANFANNETSSINNLMHHTNYMNNFSNLPVVGNSNQKPNLHNINKPLNSVNNVNPNLMKSKNYNNLNKMRPLSPIAGDSGSPNVEKLTDISQSSVPAASNLNRHRHPAPNNINKNVNVNKNLPQITLNNKWSNSVSNLSSNHFSPNEKPLNLKPNVDKFKKPISYPTDSFSVEVQSSPSKIPVCGLAGDENDLKSRWCWQVAIVSEENQFVSSGALIGTNWVLTAASAVSELVKNAKPLFVRVGDLSDLNSESAQIQKVATTYIHHNHNGETFENDIALLKLSSSIQLKSNICLICLPARGSVVQPGRRCTVAGYSLDSESLKTKEASVPIINDYQCSKKINSLTNKNFILPTSSFCTNTNNEDVNDSCSFDEGSPLGCYYEDDGYYELTGLVSYNFGCGNERVPTIYVRVSLFIAWINQIISVNN